MLKIIININLHPSNELFSCTIHVFKAPITLPKLYDIKFKNVLIPRELIGIYSIVNDIIVKHRLHQILKKNLHINNIV